MAHKETSIEGMVLDEQSRISVAELTRVCGLSIDEVRVMVGEGMLQPRDGGTPQKWSFSGVEIRRARRALRLQRDLELNLAGAALALDLLDEIELLRRRVRSLEQYLGGVRDAE
jgi:chaperone modulatory protein CbpM